MKTKVIHIGDCFINDNKVIWTATAYSEFYRKFTLISDDSTNMYLTEEQIFCNFRRCDENGVVIESESEIETEVKVEQEPKKVKIELIEELTPRQTTIYYISINGSQQMASVTFNKEEAIAEYEKTKEGYSKTKKTILKSEEI